MFVNIILSINDKLLMFLLCFTRRGFKSYGCSPNWIAGVQNIEPILLQQSYDDAEIKI